MRIEGRFEPDNENWELLDFKQKEMYRRWQQLKEQGFVKCQCIGLTPQQIQNLQEPDIDDDKICFEYTFGDTVIYIMQKDEDEE